MVRSRICITLTAAPLGDDATEEAFADWHHFVECHFAERPAIEVDAFDFWSRPRRPSVLPMVPGVSDDETRAIRVELEGLFDDWCDGRADGGAQ